MGSGVLAGGARSCTADDLATSVSMVHGIWPPDSFAARISVEHLGALMRLGRSVHYCAGDRLMTEGQPGDFVVLIRRGQAKVVISDGEGRDHLLDVTGPGELLGEMACLDGQERSATVVALGDVHGVKVSTEAFVEFVDRRPTVAKEIACLVAARLRVAHRLRLELRAHEVTLRLLHMLKDMSRVFARGGSAPSYVVPLSQDELAQLINASVVSVQRGLRQLRRLGLVSTGYRCVRVPCISCLDRYDSVSTAAGRDRAKSVMGCGGSRWHP